jgi:transcription elongation factor Elf1
MADLPVLGPDYELGFICPVCGQHWPLAMSISAVGAAVRLWCIRCNYYTDIEVGRGDN